MVDAPAGERPRPLSPHLQVWRWHITLVASIATRFTGAALYLGMLLVAGWAFALATGPDAYQTYMSLLGSIPGKVLLFGLTLCLFYHLAAGIRHLVWDMGAGFRPRTAEATAWASIAFAVIASVALWGVAAAQGSL
ncbi:MAG: succinate dehydrogenase, cytochrome b556 subunit [Caulobacteraceae bacterium]|nr:succinate dehydrogenase, cytochrome b556 subunit [Caulobacteraceae bacterium]